MVEAVQTGHPVPADVGLPLSSRCWRCRTPSTFAARQCAKCRAPLNTPEVRLLRYQSFLCDEIQRYADAGQLNQAQWKEFLTETPERQIDLLGRLEKGWSPLNQGR